MTKKTMTDKQGNQGINLDVDIQVGKSNGHVTGVHIEKLVVEQKTEKHDALLAQPVEINMIFGISAGSYEEIQKVRIEDNPMIIFFLSNKSRLLQKLRGPFTLNEKDEEVLLFPGEWIDLAYGDFRQIGTRNLDLLDKYDCLWFENPEGEKFFVPESVIWRVKEEIAEFKENPKDFGVPS